MSQWWQRAAEGVRHLAGRAWSELRSLASHSLSDPRLARIWGGERPAAGVEVTERNALTISTVWCAVRLISETIASLPLQVYERRDGGKRLASDHPAYETLHTSWNSEMGSMTARESMNSHVLLWGNTYSEIELSRGGDVLALWPLTPDRVKPFRDPKDQELKYRVDGRTVVPRDRMLHIAGLGFDGIQGYSVVTMARQSLSLTMASERFGAAFFGNGGRPAGWVEVPGRMTDTQKVDFRKDWRRIHNKGPEHPSELAFLDQGMKFHELTMPMRDAQFLETRRFQVPEVARWFRVPPHMLADLDRATFSNIEQQAMAFVIYTLRPWLVKWEQELARKLFRRDRGRFFAEHNLDALLRGDLLSRMQAFGQGRNWGLYSINDGRRRENLELLPPEVGDVHLVPGNMLRADGKPLVTKIVDVKQPAA